MLNKAVIITQIQRARWAFDGVIKNVYRHTIEEKEREMNKIANEYFQSLDGNATETATQNKKNPNIQGS